MPEVTVKEISDLVQKANEQMESFKTANDEKLDGLTEKTTEVETILKKLEETVETLQKKTARQAAASQATDEGMKRLHELNLKRHIEGKPDLDIEGYKNYVDALGQLMRKKCRCQSTYRW